MALKYKKPNAELLRELDSVSQDALNVISAVTELNFLPDDFPAAALVDICETLSDLPNGTAEGCRVPLEYARGRIPAIRRKHFLVEDVALLESDDPSLLRGMSLDRRLSELIASIATALDEYRFQASEQRDDAIASLTAIDVTNEPKIDQVTLEADKVEQAMRSASADLNEMAVNDSSNADLLSRSLKDAEGLARVSKAEVGFDAVVVRWYESIASAAKKMPKVIMTAAKAVKVGTDISKAFSARWIEMSQSLFDFGLQEIDKWADTAIEVSERLQKRIDGEAIEQPPSNAIKKDELKDGPFDSETLYKDGYISYVEKRGFYAFLLDIQNNRYYLPLEGGRLRSGSPVELGAVARFRYVENSKGKTAIEVSLYSEAVFSTNVGVLNLEKIKIDFERQIRRIAVENSADDSISVFKLGSLISAEFKSSKPLHELLGYESLYELLRQTHGLSLVGKHPNYFVKISTEQKGNDKTVLSYENFSKWIISSLKEDKNIDGILLSRIGVEARQNFSDKSGIPAALGFSGYKTLLNSIEGVGVVGQGPGTEKIVLSSMHPEIVERIKETDGTGSLCIENFSAWLEDLSASEANSGGILLSRLGQEARKHFRTEGKIPQALGFRSYAGLINEVDGFSIVGNGPTQKVVRDTR